ncbi:uncharacterized protein V6R79_015357, partial [Siganus canaliculatus]
MDLLNSTVWILLFLLLTLDHNRTVSGERLQYSRDALLKLNFAVPAAGLPDIMAQIPDHILSSPYRRTGGEARRGKRRRKRGKRGGVRLRTRRRGLDQIPLPSMVLGNA